MKLWDAGGGPMFSTDPAAITLGYAFNTSGTQLLVWSADNFVRAWEVPESTDGALMTTDEEATADASCLFVANDTVNLRDGAGTAFALAGTLEGGSQRTVLRSRTAEDGYAWLELDGSAWVRSDLGTLVGACAAFTSDTVADVTATPSRATRTPSGTANATNTPRPTNTTAPAGGGAAATNTPQPTNPPPATNTPAPPPTRTPAPPTNTPAPPTNTPVTDNDADGVPNASDNCPNTYNPDQANTDGDSQGNDCDNDDDNDGFDDGSDQCPIEFGSASGCPDNDGDGIPNHQDSCPDDFGESLYNGCPDSDGDGIPDYQDNCPFQWGYPQYSGCPGGGGPGDPPFLPQREPLAVPFTTNGTELAASIAAYLPS